MRRPLRGAPIHKAVGQMLRRKLASVVIPPLDPDPEPTAAPEVVASAVTEWGFGTTYNIPVPPGALEGDRMVIMFEAANPVVGVTDDVANAYTSLAPVEASASAHVYISDAFGAEVPTNTAVSFGTQGTYVGKAGVFLVRGATANVTGHGAFNTGWVAGVRNLPYTTEGDNEFVIGWVSFDSGGISGAVNADANHTWLLNGSDGYNNLFCGVRAAAGAQVASLAPNGAGSNALGFWVTLEGGGVSAPPPVVSEDIEVVLVASRISGVAPLAVHFSAIGTTAGLAGVTDTFRQLVYTFNFGETGLGNWPISGKSKNTEVGGPLASHVFETPGVYTVRCTGTREGSSAFGEVVITVADPATVYAGANTVVISPSGNFAGAPAGAETLTALPVIESSKRYMLRPGESFGDLSIPHGVSGAQVVALPVAGAKPIVSMLQVGAGNGPANSSFPEDITIRGLRCDGEITQTSAIRRFTLMDIDMPSGFNITLGSALGYWADPTRYGPTMPHLQEIFLVNIYGRGNTATFGLTGDLIQSAVLGCDFKTSAQHTARFWRGWQAVISHNAFRGVSSDAIRHCVKMHSSGPDAFVYGSPFGQGNTWASRWVVFSNNRASAPDDNNAFSVVFGPQNPQSAEPLEDVLVEDNAFERGPGFVSDIELAGRRMTYVNNTQAIGGGPAAVTVPGLHAAGLPSGWNSPYFNNRG